MIMSTAPLATRHLIVVLGDQLNLDSAAFDDFDPARDRVWMAEVTEESTHVPSHPVRSALFITAMRHFAEAVRARGWSLDYLALDAHDHPDLASALSASLARWRPARVIGVAAGDYRVEQSLLAVTKQVGVGLERRCDRHFIRTPEDFAAWASGRRELRLEYWYRLLRREAGLLMEGDQPAGGRWNFDADNRASFGAAGPGALPSPHPFSPDAMTRSVLDLVGQRFADHPGHLDRFDWPVTPTEARTALDDFINHRLARFGHYQDAMWENEPWLYHSRLSAALNLKLIDPMTVCRAAEAAWQDGAVPLSAAEGFIRQILGWREYVRGLYHLWMPDWLGWNALDARAPLPAFYWNGATDMACLRAVITQVLDTGYAHHIQRLMVTGLYALLLGVRPGDIHAWFLATHIDAVEWVELPNVLGMSQHADGGRMASKPYIASGKYIQRMSNHCAGCRFDPAQASGPRACPFTTLYWDFLDRHAVRFRAHPRLGQQVRNLERKDASSLAEIRSAATRLGRVR